MQAGTVQQYEIREAMIDDVEAIRTMHAQPMTLVDAWANEINLKTVSYNECAKAFYRKYGFVDTGKVDELFKGKMPVGRMVCAKGGGV